MTMTREEKNEDKQKEIKKEESHEKLKKRLGLWAKIFLFAAILCFGFFLYLRYVSTSGLVVREYRIESTTLPKSFHGAKVIQFSDLHYGTTIFQKELAHIVEEINQRKPDLVFFTGDLVDDSYELDIKEKQVIINLLKKIDASVGKYAVAGNHDYENESFPLIMQDSNFTILNNQADLIYLNGYDPLLLVGLTDTIKTEVNIDQAFSYFKEEGSNQDIFTMTLLHEPDTIDQVLSSYKTDIAFSGHSHNGQVRLPFIGSVVKIKGAKKYSESYYQVKDTELFVSGGIGTSTYPLRWFNRPSINFYRLAKV